jgi:hypothetical protein
MAAERPRAELASWPTPLEPAPRLAAASGNLALDGLFGHPDTVRRAAAAVR